EAILLPAALLVEADGLDREQAAATDAFLAAAAVPLIVAGPEPRRTGQPRGLRVTVPKLDDAEQLDLWAAAFSGVPGVERHQLRPLVAQFQLPPHVVRTAAAQVGQELAAV